MTDKKIYDINIVRKKITSKGVIMRNIEDIKNDVIKHNLARYTGEFTPQEWWDKDADLSVELWEANYNLRFKKLRKG